MYIDDDCWFVKMGDKEIYFMLIEYKILFLLVCYVGKVFMYDFIICEIWGFYLSEN